MKQCLDSAKTLRESTEDLQCTLADFRTGSSMLDTLHDRCTGFRDKVAGVLQRLADRGVNIFDQAYKDIPGSNPKRYTTAYDGQCDGELTKLYDDLLREVNGLTYSLAVDNNGYAPAHNSQFPTRRPATPRSTSANAATSVSSTIRSGSSWRKTRNPRCSSRPTSVIPARFSTTCRCRS